MSDPLTAARSYRAAGLCPIAIKADGTKAPLVGRWKQYQYRLPTDRELLDWFSNRRAGVAVLTGTTSGNLEISDFDENELFWLLRELLEAEVPGLFGRLVWIVTPSGGHHLAYRSSCVAGNAKLAMRLESETERGDRVAGLLRRGLPITAQQRAPRQVTMIETRGEGGYAATVPTPGYTLRQGDLAHLPILNEAEHAALFRVARSFDEVPRRAAGDRRPDAGRRCGPRRPSPFAGIDDLQTLALLQRHGWAVDHWAAGVAYLTRPGKDAGVSATWGYHVGYLIVFSTNAPPFEATSSDRPRAYNALQIRALLEHDGDEAAARLMRARDRYCARPIAVAKPIDPGRTLTAADLAGLRVPTGRAIFPTDPIHPTDFQRPSGTRHDEQGYAE